MKIFDCKCEGCQAEFQAVLESDQDTVKCPACDSDKVTMSESSTPAGCGSGCGGCSGSCGTE